MGDIADQFLYCLLILLALPPTFLHTIIVLKKFPLYFGDLRIFIWMIILRFTIVHERVYRLTDSIDELGLPPSLPPVPQNYQPEYGGTADKDKHPHICGRNVIPQQTLKYDQERCD